MHTARLSNLEEYKKLHETHMPDRAHLLKLQQSLLEDAKAEQSLLGVCECFVKMPACGIMPACKTATIGPGGVSSLQDE